MGETVGDMGSLHKSLEEDNLFFKQMIDLIPAKAYFNSDTKSQIIEDELEQMKTNEQKDVGRFHDCLV